MRTRVARRIVIVAVLMTSGAAALPGLAQPSPAANRIYLPGIGKPLLVEITDSAFFSGGKVPGFGVQGHVRNNGATSVYAVTLHADFFDLQGHLVASPTFAAALPAIFPGETIPFRFKVFWPLNLDPYQHSHYDLAVLSFDHSSTVTYVPVTIVSMQIHRDAERGVVYRVEGELRNDQSRVLHDVLVVASNGLGEYEIAANFAVFGPGSRAAYDTGELVYREWFNDVVTVQGVGMLAP